MLSGSFRVDTNKLACQTCLLQVMRVDPFLIVSLSGRPVYDSNPLSSNLTRKNPCRVCVVFAGWVEH